MKSTPPGQLPRKDIIERIVDVVLIRRPMSRLGQWLDHRLFRVDVYDLRGDEVVPGRRAQPRFRVREASSWQQVFISLNVPLIVIQFADGRTLELSDRHEDLLRIMRSTIPERELPWKAV